MPGFSQIGKPLWKMVLYTRQGQPIGPIHDARGRKLGLKINDIDNLNFSLPLNHHFASQIKPLETVIKVWRSISIPGEADYYAPTDPIFCGVVGPIDEDSGGKDIPITAYSPLWRLQYRFLREVIRLGTPAPLVGAAMDQSAMMEYLIDYTNAFDFTGIEIGTLPATIARRREFKRRSQIWKEIQGLASLSDGVDIVPRYVHVADGDSTMMVFNTQDARGIKLPSVQFHYNMGQKNAATASRQFDVSEIATRVDIDAEGPTDTSISVAVTDAEALDRYGLYERVENVNNITDSTSMTEYGNTLLDQYSSPQMAVNVTAKAGRSPYFGRDYNLGDIVAFRANEGRMNFAVLKRIYGADLEMSDNNEETVTLSTARDSTGQVVDSNEDFHEELLNVDGGGATG